MDYVATTWRNHGAASEIASAFPHCFSRGGSPSGRYRSTNCVGHFALFDAPRTSKDKSTVMSLKRLARIAGLLYLVVGVFGGFAIAYVTAKVYVPGDAATTAGNVLANAGLVRIGVIADLIQATVFVFLGMTLYLVLKHVNKNAASAMVIIVAIATTMMCINKVFQFAALLVATDPSYTAAFGTAGSNLLVMLVLDIHNYGFLIAQIFFGLWLVPLGYLVYRSGMFPKVHPPDSRRPPR